MTRITLNFEILPVKDPTKVITDWGSTLSGGLVWVGWRSMEYCPWNTYPDA